MKESPDSQDPLDELFAAVPQAPRKGFADRTLARLEREGQGLGEDGLDAEIDSMLAAQEVVASEGFASRVITALDMPEAEVNEADSSDKVVGFPSWVVAMGGIAALMVLGMFSFIYLFQFAADQKSARDQRFAEQSPPAVQVVAPEADTAMLAAAPALDVALPEEAEVLDYESVLAMDDALADAMLLADSETLSALQAFMN
ncbi:MAG: hypothetical protein ACQKBV_01110 [Puniceicoccales bacterium]